MARSLQELTNRVLLILDEPGANPGGPPAIPAGSLFTQPLITDILNEGVAVFIEEAGYAPTLLDKLATLPIVAGADYALPADLVSLQRVEYRAGAAGAPMLIPVMDFDHFDLYSGGDNAATGAPQIARAPFAGSMRLWPQPTAQNVANADAIILYYASYGTTLVNLADTINLPQEFAEVPVSYALSRLFPRKLRYPDADLWEKRFLRTCQRAKTKLYANDADVSMQIGDAEIESDESLYRYY